ncbi:MAG: hypothetical protein K6C30_04745 [Bacteroidaceae bacterium]|nr:hypothetical protein [Bacteroidaceae bacterium]
MLSLFFSFLLTIQPPDSIAHDKELAAADSIAADTLQEVTVRAGRHIPLPGMVVGGSKDGAVVAPPSLSAILEKLSPGLTDKIMHPFAFRQRKKEGRRKRSLKALEDFDKVKTFNDLLREAYQQQLLEDSLEKKLFEQQQ